MIKKIIGSPLIKNSFFYTCANLLNAAIPFLILPVLTKYLTPQDYGVVSVFQIILSMLLILIGLNTQGIISVNFFKLPYEKFKEFFGSVLSILSVSFLTIFITVFFTHSLFQRWLNIDENWILFACVISFFQFIIATNLIYWQVQKRALSYGILQVSLTTLNIGFSLIFVIGFKYNWQGRLLGIGVATILIGLISAFFLKKYKLLSLNFNSKNIKEALSFSIPLIPHSLSGWATTALDRIFITSMIGLTITGIYTVGYQFGMIVGLLATSFNKAWAPYFYEMLNKNDLQLKNKIVKVTYLYFIGINLIALFISLISPLLIKLFIDQKFSSASQFIPWVAFGYAATGMYYMVTNYVFYLKKTKLLAWATFSSTILNAILNYFLIKHFGAVGAAISTLITAMTLFIVVWILSSRLYPMPWFSFLKNNEK